jgi:hypothetical protein
MRKGEIRTEEYRGFRSTGTPACAHFAKFTQAGVRDYILDTRNHSCYSFSVSTNFIAKVEYPAADQSLRLLTTASTFDRTVLSNHIYRPQLTHCCCCGNGFIGGIGKFIEEPHSHFNASSFSSLASIIMAFFGVNSYPFFVFVTFSNLAMCFLMRAWPFGLNRCRIASSLVMSFGCFLIFFVTGASWTI